MAATAVAIPAPRSWFQEKILLGMTPRDYARSLVTPGNLLAAAILLVGVPLYVYRFAMGLGATTNLSQLQPWGIWIGFDMMTGIVLAAGGFTLGAAVEIFGMEEYHPIVRPALLTAFLGYLMAIVGLIADLGKPWNMVRVIVSNGSTSALYEVAWCVMLYTTVLFLEFLNPVFEWLGWGKGVRVMRKLMLPLTVLSVMFSTMHQSALGSLFLLMPGRLHPLWYSPYIFIFFYISAIAAGISMVIFEGTLSHKAFQHRIAGHHVDVDKLQLGLAKAGAIVLFAYFFLKLQGVSEGNHWDLLFTGYGLWFLVEIVGFVLVPSLMYGYGARSGKVKLVQWASGIAVLGIAVNRLNCSVIAFNWDKPWSVRYVPSWMEVAISLALVTIGVLAFKFIVNRMPILSEDPRWAAEH